MNDGGIASIKIRGELIRKRQGQSKRAPTNKQTIKQTPLLTLALQPTVVMFEAGGPFVHSSVAPVY